MKSEHPPKTYPTDPTCPNPDHVPHENTAKHGENDASGHIGHVGHVSGIPALLNGLFVDYVPSTTPTTETPPGMDYETDEGTETSFGCGFCGATDLVDDAVGLRCDACGHLAWLDVDGALTRVSWHDHDVASMAPDDLPDCSVCGDLCDTRTADGCWRCSRCDPDAESRRRRTKRLIETARRIRKRDGEANNETGTLTDAAARLIPESRIPDPVRRGAFDSSGQQRELNNGKSV